MARFLTNRFCQLGIGLLSALLMAGLWPSTASPTPAQVRVGQFIPVAEVTVQLQSQSGDQDTSALPDLTYRQVSDYQSFSPGRYILTVQTGDQVLLQSTYGLGAGDRYTLALYGLLPEQSVTNPHTKIAQLKRIFGGVDADAVNGYLAQMALLHDKVSSQTDGPQVRLVHLAPGIVPVTMEIQAVAKTALSRQIAYPEASEAESVEGNAEDFAIEMHGGAVAIAPQPLALEPHTLTDIFVVGGLTAPQPIEIVVAKPVSTDASNPSKSVGRQL